MNLNNHELKDKEYYTFIAEQKSIWARLLKLFIGKWSHIGVLEYDPNIQSIELHSLNLQGYEHIKVGDSLPYTDLRIGNNKLNHVNITNEHKQIKYSILYNLNWLFNKLRLYKIRFTGCNCVKWFYFVCESYDIPIISPEKAFIWQEGAKPHSNPIWEVSKTQSGGLSIERIK